MYFLQIEGKPSASTKIMACFHCSTYFTEVVGVRVASDVGCEGIHKDKKRQRAKFLHFPRWDRGLVWRDTPAVRAGGFELLLD